MSAVRLVFLATLALAAFGCSPIVGGACRPGTIVCEGRCVDPSADDHACGGCGIVCGAAEHCLAGACVASSLDGGVPSDAMPDAGVPTDGDAGGPFDGGTTPDGGSVDPDGGEGRDGGTVDPDGGVPPDGSVGTDDGGVPRDGAVVPVCDLGQLECDGHCVDPRTDATACGGCGIVCSAAQFCEAGACVDECGPGTTRCGRACVSLLDDPDHCGACFRSCESGICELGVCSGRLAGHVVLVGHDYVVSRAAMDRVLGNAVLLSGAATIDVLEYRGTATDASVAGVERAIDSVASAMSRRVVRSLAPDATSVTSALASADVFVVHAQASGTDVDLETLGAQWSLALDSFLARGGVVVSLETMAAHRGTWSILEAAGLVEVGRSEDATGALVGIVAPGDAIAIGVPLTYRGERLSVRFVDAGLPAVATDGIGGIVLHLTVVGP